MTCHIAVTQSVFFGTQFTVTKLGVYYIYPLRFSLRETRMPYTSTGRVRGSQPHCSYDDPSDEKEVISIRLLEGSTHTRKYKVVPILNRDTMSILSNIPLRQHSKCPPCNPVPSATTLQERGIHMVECPREMSVTHYGLH